MHRPFAIACALIWMALVLTTSRAADAQATRASDAKELARQRFREATDAYQAERYSAAASLFEAADRLAPHASTRYNAAAAWDQAGEAARAATGYQAVLEIDTLDQRRRAQATERLGVLKATLGRVEISTPLGALVTVDHVQRAPVPTSFYLDPGQYDFAVEYRGTSTTIRAGVVGAQSQNVDLQLPPTNLPVVAPTPPESPAPVGAPEREPLGSDQKTWGWVSVGAGVALGTAAVVLGLKALSARNTFRNSQNTDASAYQEAKDLRLATNVLWGGAGVAGATGMLLLLTAPTIEF